MFKGQLFNEKWTHIEDRPCICRAYVRVFMHGSCMDIYGLYAKHDMLLFESMSSVAVGIRHIWISTKMPLLIESLFRSLPPPPAFRMPKQLDPYE